MSKRACSIAVVAFVLTSALASVVVGAQVAGSAPNDLDSSASVSIDSTSVDDHDVALEHVSGDQRIRQVTSGNENLESGESFWKGQRLHLDVGAAIDGSSAAKTFELWRVTDDGRLNQRVRTFTVDESGRHVLETGSIEGRYAIRYEDRPVYVDGGTAFLDTRPDGSQVTVANSAFRVKRQTLSFGWSDPTVYPGQDTTLTIESNRDSYVAVVSGTGLSYRYLTTLFPKTVYAADYDALSEEDKLLIEVEAGRDLRLNTAVLKPGTNRFTIDAVDTTAAVSVPLTVNEPDPNQRFLSVDQSVTVGDTSTVELSCTHCFLVVGTPEQHVVDVLELRDENGDEQITLQINTRYAGQYVGASGYPSRAKPYTSPGDTIIRYSPSTKLERIDQELTYTINQLGKLRDRLGLDSKGRDRPLEAGTLDLTVAETDFLIARSSWGNQRPLGSDLVVRDETDARTIRLEPRSLKGAQSLAAPGGSSFEPTAERLAEDSAPRQQIALGDRLVFRIDVSGVFGYLDEYGASLETLQENEDEGIRLSVTSLSDDSGTSEEPVQLDRTDVTFVTDLSSQHLYVVFRTGEKGSSRLQAGQYQLEFALQGVPARHGAYSNLGAHDGYPYLDPGEREIVSEVAVVMPAKATIADPAEGESPHLTADGKLVLHGTTTVVPGNSLWVHASSSQYAWETTVRGRVNETGHWTASLALADAPGDEFTVSVSRGGERLDEGTYTVQPPLENPSDGGGSGDGDQSNDASGTLGGDDGGGLLSAIPGLAGLSGLAGPIGGGIGVIAVVWVGWKLVIRRLIL